MTDILIDKNTGDLVISDGDLVLIDTVQEAASQRLTIKLNTYLGEWFADLEHGVPYFQSIFKKGVEKLTIDAIMQSVILEDDDIQSITVFKSEISGVEYRMTFTALSNSGEVIQYTNTFRG